MKSETYRNNYQIEQKTTKIGNVSGAKNCILMVKPKPRNQPQIAHQRISETCLGTMILSTLFFLYCISFSLSMLNFFFF